MIFQVEEIGEQGLRFEDSKRKEWLEISDENGDIKLNSDIRFKASLEKTEDNSIRVTGGVSFEISSPCSRCLKSAAEKVEHTIEFFLHISDERQMKTRRIDLSDNMREQVAMALPQKVLCGDMCRGLCPRCGTDLNERTCECGTEREQSRFEKLRPLSLRANG